MKTTQEIYEAMLASVQARSGFTMDDSCDLAVRLYAAAAQLESLYAYADWSRKQCFPQTATGEYLDLHAELHGVSREAAQAATGILSLCLAEALDFDLSIPEDTCFCVPGGPLYRIMEPCIIPAGIRQVGVEAQCTVAGAIGNAGIAEICGMLDAPPYLAAVFNESSFSGGKEAESDEHLRLRVLDACRRKPNGANCAYYEALALTVPDITSAAATAGDPDDGWVTLCVSANYTSPTNDQIDAVYAALADRTELGVNLSVTSPTITPLNLVLKVWPAAGVPASSAIAAVYAAMEDYFADPLLRQGFYRAQAGNRIYNTGLVQNYTFTAPAQDYAPSPTKLYVLGSLQVSEGT